MAVAMQVNEVEETIKRVLSHDRVSRYMVFNKDGIVLKYDGWNESQDQGYQECVQIAATVAPLVHHSSKSCQDLLVPPNNDLECIRLKTRNYEMIVAPGKTFTMVAFQDDQDSKGEATEETTE